MDEKNKVEIKKRHGISLKSLSYVMCGMIIIIAVLTLVSTYVSANKYSRVREYTLNYIEQQQVAELLKDGSDYLTEEVRAFTVTADRTHLDNYFKEANVTKRRDMALDQLKKDLDGTASYASLTESMNTSIKLMDREYYAMRLTIEARGYDITEYPEAIRNVKLKESDLKLSKEEMALKAEEMVFDDEYHWYKEKIYSELQNCLNALAESTEENVEASFEHLNVLFVIQHVLMISLVIVTVVMIIITSIQVISPLIRAIPRIKEDLPLAVHGAYEYKYLAQTYNKMFEAHRRQKKILAYEAAHDELTGLLNRNGLNKAIKHISLENTALLIIDIDDFKMVNDSKGHVIGDETLKSVADEIERSFDADDIVSRIGGDEFLVLMTDVSDCAEFRHLISTRLAHINESLAYKSDDIPPVSVSIGVSFGHNDSEFTEMEKKADEALYQVKNSGKKNYAFFEENTK